MTVVTCKIHILKYKQTHLLTGVIRKQHKLVDKNMFKKKKTSKLILIIVAI